jgi:uncharacterized protein (TIGR03435 family)
MKMQCMWMWILSAGMTLLAGILLGQGAHPAPTFEVASIKPAPPFSLENLQSGRLHVASITGSQANFQFVSLSDLLAYAFRAKPYQISGPSWIRDGRWDLVAKLPKGASQDRVPEMVQSMLVERFKLAAHQESHENPAYELVVDKGGPKLKPSPPEDDSPASKDGVPTSAPALPLGGFPGGGGNMRFGNDGRGVITGNPNGTTRVSQAPSGGMRFEMSKMTMSALAEMLTPFVDRPVIHRTGLKGTYQVTLDVPFDAMMRVIQNLGAQPPYRVASRVASSAADSAVPEGRRARGARGPHRTRRHRQSFSQCSNSARSSSLVRFP